MGAAGGKARGVYEAISIYEKVFGLGEKKSEMATGRDYTSSWPAARTSRAGWR